jgi:hypothetical protein
MPLKSATFKKVKLSPREPGDQNVTLYALIAGEIAIRQAQVFRTDPREIGYITLHQVPIKCELVVLSYSHGIAKRSLAR